MRVLIQERWSILMIVNYHIYLITRRTIRVNYNTLIDLVSLRQILAQHLNEMFFINLTHHSAMSNRLG